jgi:hypothetical protein
MAKKTKITGEMMRNRPILLSFLLALPVLLFLLHHYFYHSTSLQATGFTVDENVLYMSYARQYLDSDNFHLFYSNPFDGDPDSPKIYFQPVNLLLAAVIKLGCPPGLAFSLFGLLMAVACIYIGIRIIRLLVPTSGYPVLTTVLFTWGGGLIAFTGLAAALVFPERAFPSFADNILITDPANGWWGLNWGRNLFIPLEAYYHFLFLLNIYFILRKKWIASLAAALFLSISHPFTGIAFLLVATAWAGTERVFLKNRVIKWWYVVGLAAITGFHAWYYLAWLNSFPEHKLIFSQYSAGWTYSLLVALPAYCLVLAAAIFAFRKWKPKFGLPGSSRQRLFLCWAVITFLLSKHEWFMKPMQPIHFTRGYTWAGLFLFALPGILAIIEYLQHKKRKWLLVLVVAVFLSDNVLWTANLLRKKETSEWEGHLTNETKAVLDFLEKNCTPNDLIVGNVPLIMYLSNAFSPANSWVSHPYNTPDKKARLKIMEKYLADGILPEAWKGRRILIILDGKSAVKNDRFDKYGLFYQGSRYRIFTP